MLAKTQDNEEIIERVAALDIGKAELMCCVQFPMGPSGQAGCRRWTDLSDDDPVADFDGVDHLACLGVTRVVMEATPDYWKPVFYLLEAAGFETWLVNAKDVKHLPGRPKTDRLDAVWLCKVAERQMIRPSFVPHRLICRLRDLTRYRADLVAARTAEKNRVEKAARRCADQAERGRLGHLRGLRAGHAGRAGRPDERKSPGIPGAVGLAA